MTATATRSTLPPPPPRRDATRRTPPPPVWAPRRTYRPIGALAGWLEGITASGIVVSLALAAAAHGGIEVRGDLLLVPSSVQALIIAEFLLLVALRVLAHVWSYRAAANADAMGAAGLDYTPASTVWWWYVPVLSLFKPAAALRQVAQASEPGYEAGTDAWRRRDPDALVAAWWGAYLAVVIGGQVALVTGAGSSGERAAWTVVGLGLAGALALWWAVVRRITRLQRHRAVRLARAGGLPERFADHGAT